MFVMAQRSTTWSVRFLCKATFIFADEWYRYDFWSRCAPSPLDTVAVSKTWNPTTTARICKHAQKGV